MDLNNPELTAYLNQVKDMTGADPDQQASMYDAGEALGLDRSQAEEMAQALFIEEYAELKTLSGGIGITEAGLNALGVSLPKSAKGNARDTISREYMMTEEDRQVLDRLLEEVKTAIAGQPADYTLLDTVVTDIKTMELHMLSPEPKTGVIRALIDSLRHAFSGQTAHAALCDRLQSVVQ